jgi:hypothetical protein
VPTRQPLRGDGVLSRISPKGWECHFRPLFSFSTAWTGVGYLERFRDKLWLEILPSLAGMKKLKKLWFCRPIKNSSQIINSYDRKFSLVVNTLVFWTCSEMLLYFFTAACFSSAESLTSKNPYLAAMVKGFVNLWNFFYHKFIQLLT